MAEGGNKDSYGADEDRSSTCVDNSTWQSSRTRPSSCSGLSLDSSGIGTMGQSHFMMSCSGSELSIRTGSVTYTRLPPRPVPPPPPPKPRHLARRKAPPSPSFSSETSPTNSTITLKMDRPGSKKEPAAVKACSRNHPSFSSQVSTKFNHWKRNSLRDDDPSMTFSSKSVQHILNSLRDEDTSMTFSSNSVQHILNSIAPSYPPPLPPEPLPEIPPRPPNHVLATLQPLPPYTALDSSEVQMLRSSSYISPEYYPYSEIQKRRVCCPRKSQRLCFLSTVSLTLSLACCGFLVFVFVHYIHPRLPQQACVRAHNDSGTVSAVFNNSMVKRSGDYCSASGVDVSHLLLAMMRNHTMNNARCSTLGFASAHKYLQTYSFNYCGSDRTFNLQLNMSISKNEEFKQHATNVEVTSNALRLLHSGWYFVYSSINFHPKECPVNKQKRDYYVIRAKLGGSQTVTTLAQSSHVCMQNCNNDFHTGYTGGVFHLEKDDLVFVNVSSPNGVTVDGRWSFIGLVMVAASDL